MAINNLIPFSSPELRFDQFKNELSEAFQSVAASNNYILGNEVKEFEASFSKYIKTNYCIGVNSATDGLALSLMALGIKSGDEVITTGLTAPATITAILQTDAKPVVVDILETTLCINPDQVKKAINNKTKAIIPVHLHGFSCEMDEIMAIAQENNLSVIEDCSQAHGASFNPKKLGSIGHVGVFSFYPTKNLGCMGDGGAVTTNDEEVAHKIRSLRNYGIQENGEVIHSGMNSRLDEVQAAMLNVLLPHLDAYNHRRQHYARLYTELLNKDLIKLPILSDDAVYHQFPIRVKNRDLFRESLESQGLLTGIHYQKSIDQHTAFKQYCKPLPVANKASNELVSLPIQPEILDEHFGDIYSTINKVIDTFK